MAWSELLLLVGITMDKTRGARRSIPNVLKKKASTLKSTKKPATANVSVSSSPSGSDWSRLVIDPLPVNASAEALDLLAMIQSAALKCAVEWQNAGLLNVC